MHSTEYRTGQPGYHCPNHDWVKDPVVKVIHHINLNKGEVRLSRQHGKRPWSGQENSTTAAGLHNSDIHHFYMKKTLVKL